VRRSNGHRENYRKIRMVANRLMVLLAMFAVTAAIAAQQMQPKATASAAPSPVPAAASPAPAGGADPRIEIANRIGAKPDELRSTPVPGMYELTRGSDIVYVTADGKFAFTGDLIELNGNNNLTEERRRDLRVKALAAYPESQMLVFGPKDPKYTITVFTDVDCPYCRKLHSQIAEYNHLGIRVRYLLYPRTGPNTESWTKAEQVWCSADRNDALTRAKLGQDLKTKVCTDNPVARSYQLGQDFNVAGTPAIVLANGEMLPGYVPPDTLVEHLKEANN
jgi:thiol:disulfide interchange protein DsbC